MSTPGEVEDGAREEEEREEAREGAHEEERQDGERERKPEEEEREDPATVLRELLEEIVDSMALDVDVRIERSEGTLTGSVEGEDVGLFIGRRGQTIDAVQHLAQRIVFQGPPTHGSPDARVVIDADGYRERRAEALRSIALDAAEESLRSGQAVELDPMPASERRIVHEYLRERGGVKTHSEGDEPERYLVVEPGEA